MICVRKACVYTLFCGFIFCSTSVLASGRDDKNLNAETNRPVNTAGKDQFQWQEHNKLSWNDFRGAVNATTGESAAATHCGFGFRTKPNATNSKMEIVVYNTFYAEKSWVRADAKIASILDHEQGHFDLCEIYTRKLRAHMSQFDFRAADLQQALMNIYSEVSNEYESRQQAYEQETTHGTNIRQQKKWQEMIANELM